MQEYISSDFELYEVLNEFPILEKSLSKMHFNPLDIKEGESISEFFGRLSMDEDEINLIIKKLNRDINIYLKQEYSPIATSTVGQTQTNIVEEE